MNRRGSIFPFRSASTCTPTRRPSRRAAMKQAMMEAEVGDEQAGSDPSVWALCDRVAALLGKQAAVFLPSGTMCNQVAIATHCRPGDEILAHETAHIITSEAGAPGAIAGVSIKGLQRRTRPVHRRSGGGGDPPAQPQQPAADAAGGGANRQPRRRRVLERRGAAGGDGRLRTGMGWRRTWTAPAAERRGGAGGECAAK